MYATRKAAKYTRLRIDIAYYGDGFMSWEIMEPDTSKNGNSSNTRKWRSHGTGMMRRFPVDEISSFQDAGPIESLVRRIKYDIRCVESDRSQRMASKLKAIS